MYTHTGVLNAILYANINNNTKTNQYLNKYLHTGVLNAILHKNNLNMLIKYPFN